MSMIYEFVYKFIYVWNCMMILIPEDIKHEVPLADVQAARQRMSEPSGMSVLWGSQDKPGYHQGFKFLIGSE